MSSTLTPSTNAASTTAIPAQRQPTRRRVSRRTAWVVAGTAAVVIGGAAGAVAAASMHDAPAQAIDTNWSPRADAAESSHGFGPGVPALNAAALEGPVRGGADAILLVHGTRGSLSDAAGRPLHF